MLHRPSPRPTDPQQALIGNRTGWTRKETPVSPPVFDGSIAYGARRPPPAAHSFAPPRRHAHPRHSPGSEGSRGSFRCAGSFSADGNALTQPRPVSLTVGLNDSSPPADRAKFPPKLASPKTVISDPPMLIAPVGRQRHQDCVSGAHTDKEGPVTRCRARLGLGARITAVVCLLKLTLQPVRKGRKWKNRGGRMPCTPGFQCIPTCGC